MKAAKQEQRRETSCWADSGSFCLCRKTFWFQSSTVFSWSNIQHPTSNIQHPFLIRQESVFKLKVKQGKRSSLLPLLLSNNWKPVRSVPPFYCFFFSENWNIFVFKAPRTAGNTFHLELQRHKDASDRRETLFKTKVAAMLMAHKHESFKFTSNQLFIMVQQIKKMNKRRFSMQVSMLAYKMQMSIMLISC